MKVIKTIVSGKTYVDVTYTDGNTVGFLDVKEIRFDLKNDQAEFEFNDGRKEYLILDPNWDWVNADEIV